MQEYITVSLLNKYIHNSIASEELLRSITVYGEISAYKISGPHAYFNLKDKDASINCNCFNYTRYYKPKEGESVLVKGTVDYYVKGGRLSFIVEKIEPVGQGLLAMQLEELKKKLLQEGLFDVSHKKQIPSYMSKVCVLTSRTGAVIRDIITTVRKNCKGLNIFLYDVRVQGEGAHQTIINALKVVDAMGFDAIVIARGGGSFEDLMPFNNESLARAIYTAKTPIISSVGHETDFTICDMVADLRVATPTAAGEVISYNDKELMQSFNDLITLGYKKLLDNFEFFRQKLKNQCELLESKTDKLFISKINALKLSASTLKYLMSNYIESREKEFNKQVSLLDAHNPTNILKKGFFKASHNGKEIEYPYKVNVGETLIFRGYKIKMTTKIIDVEVEK